MKSAADPPLFDPQNPPRQALSLPLCWGVAMAWLVGVACQLQQRALWPAEIYGPMLLVGVSGLLLWFRWRASVLALFIACGSIFSAGWAVAGLHGHHGLAQQLAPALEGVDLRLTGVVTGLPKRSHAGWRFVLAVEEAQRAMPSGETGSEEALTAPPQVSLSWYPNGGAAWTHQPLQAHQAMPMLKAGQRWRFTVRLKRPHGLMNPHGFDYELLLLEQGIGATGYVKNGTAQWLQDDAGYGVQVARQRVKDAIEQQVVEPRLAGVLAGLAVGDQSAIDREDWALFRTTGIAHLVSISGLHVTMFGWLAGALIQMVWRRSPRACLAWPAPRAGRWGGLLAAAAYAMFSGGGVPAQRTVWMLVVVTVVDASGRRWPWGLVLLGAAAVVTLLDPWALLQPGFWLSFTAVGLLMASSVGMPAQGRALTPHESASVGAGSSASFRSAIWLWSKIEPMVLSGIRAQAIATVGLAPLSLVFFQQLSLVGFLANLLAIPLVSLVITPLALLGVVWPLLWSGAAWLLQVLSIYLSWLASWPGAVWTVAAAPVWAQLAALLGALVLVLPWPWRLRVLAVPLCLPLCVPATVRPSLGQFEVMAADIGQGTAVLVRTQGHLLVFDTGPQYSPESDAGQRVLVPLLESLGERRIDALVLSHRDLDHVGGAAALLHRFPVDHLMSSLESDHPLRTEARGRGVSLQSCQAGQVWEWDGVRFAFIHPHADDYAQPLRPNAMSCVLQVQAAANSGQAGARLLLTGDIEREQELRLVSTHGDGLRSEVLIVPHHGSKTSSTSPFLDAVQPKVAVVQAGYRNRFGHPAAEVLARLTARGLTVVNSVDCGAWLWSSDASMYPASGLCWRDHALRYWQDPPAR